MVSYAFEKLYADLVAEDGSVCIVYVVWTELFGLRHGSAGYELYTPSGSREVVHSRSVPPRPSAGAECWALQLDVPGGPFELVLESAPLPSEVTLSVPGLTWSVQKQRCAAGARWLGAPARSPLRGLGYADWVRLSKPTRRLGLSRVDWGRAHLGNASWVWNRVQRAGYDTVMRLFVFDDDRQVAGDAFTVDEANIATLIHAKSIPALTLAGPRVLHEGSPLDAQRIPSSLARAAARLLSPQMYETRCLSRARVAERGETGWALHECVEFGTRAARSAA